MQPRPVLCAVATQIFIGVTTAATGANVTACVYVHSTRDGSNYRHLTFTAGSEFDKCMQPSGYTATLEINEGDVGVFCVPLGYVEPIIDGCDFENPWWEFGVRMDDVGELKGTTINWINDGQSMTIYPDGTLPTHLCSDQTQCGNDRMTWADGTVQDIYVITRPYCFDAFQMEFQGIGWDWDEDIDYPHNTCLT